MNIIDPIFQLMTFQSYMKELERVVTLENISVHLFLPHINSLLYKAALISMSSRRHVEISSKGKK